MTECEKWIEAVLSFDTDELIYEAWWKESELTARWPWRSIPFARELMVRELIRAAKEMEAAK